LFLVAILTLAVPMQAVAAIATELCLTFGASTLPHDHGAGPGGSAASAHDHGAHGHADNDAPDTVHCGQCATAFIAAAPKLSAAAVPQGGIASPLLPSPGSWLPRELDRPPLAL
jgi:hypothetical protein